MRGWPYGEIKASLQYESSELAAASQALALRVWLCREKTFWVRMGAHPRLREQRQEDLRFKDSIDYLMRLCQKAKDWGYSLVVECLPIIQKVQRNTQ